MSAAAREAHRPRRNWDAVAKFRGREAEERVQRVLLAGPRRYPLQVNSAIMTALTFVPAHLAGIGVVVAPIELDDATALGRALGVLILQRECRCTRAAMTAVLLELLQAERGALPGGRSGYW